MELRPSVACRIYSFRTKAVDTENVNDEQNVSENSFYHIF